jgi:hypothetical protein
MRRDGAFFQGADLLTFQPVQLRGERIGTIYLRSATSTDIQLLRSVETGQRVC